MSEIENMGFDELRGKLVQLTEEQNAVGAQLEDVKKALTVKLQEMESLRDSLENGKVVTVPVASKPRTITIDLNAVWQFCLSYVVPVLVVLVVLGIATKFIRGKQTRRADNRSVIEMNVADLTGDSYEIG